MGKLRRTIHIGILLSAVVVGSPPPPQAQVAPPLHTQPIPLVLGLTLTDAVQTSAGDYETTLKIFREDKEALHLVWTATGSSRRRLVRREDIRSSRFFLMRWSPRYDRVIPGSNAFGASTLVLNELKSTGKSDFSCCFMLNTDGEHPSGTISVVNKKPVTVPVLVNDQPVLLPAIHVAGTLGQRQAEFHFLDDAANPIGLRWSVGNHQGRTDEQGRIEQTGQIVKIAFPTAASTKRIEHALTESGRVDVYGIYFEFGSATLTQDSEPVLREIADVMRRNRTWSLNVEGHTDNIGGDAANVDLSLRRANAVKEALVSRHRVPAARLETSGFGARRPKDSNTTVEGRARNRRVELVRQGSRAK